MSKFISKTIFLFLLVFLISAFNTLNAIIIVNAQSSNDIAEAKILPSSPFYFLKEWARGIQMFFAFNPIKKAELETKFSNEKLNEALVLVKKESENKKAIEKAFNNYQKSQEKLAQRIEKLKETSQDPKVDELLTKITEKAILHQTKLDDLKISKPEVLPIPALAPTIVLSKVILKDTPEKFSQKVEKAAEKLPYELKEIKAIEMLNQVETQVPKPAKPVIAQIKEKLEEKAITKIAESSLVPIVPKVQEIPGEPQAKLKVLEDLEAKATKVLPLQPSAKIPEKIPAPPQASEVIKEIVKEIKTEIYPQCGKIRCIRYDPVCGVDNKTYACGEADAESCGVKVAYKGECKRCISRPHCLDQMPPCLLPEPTEGWCPSSAPEIISFSIEPTRSESGWIMYEDGAKAVLVGKNIKSAIVMTVPSGTEIDKATKLGDMVKVADGRWEFLLPKFLLVTNFWAEIKGFDDSVVKSKDLGNVGYIE